MSASQRQNVLFAAEDWKRAYEALTSVDFTAYDQDTLRQAMAEYIRRTYPEDYNDWIGSAEQVIKLDILAWLSQNIAYRHDMNSREAFMLVAERRESLLRLAQNIAYNVSRNRPASGEVKITSVQTNQPLTDSDGNPIGLVRWNNPTDPDWFEKFITVMNAAFTQRTKFGRPLRKHNADGRSLQIYRFNSLVTATSVYPFQATVNGNPMPFDIVNVDLDEITGVYQEMPPNPSNAFHVLYRSDGRGTGSGGTGFFFPIRQGAMGYQDETFDEAQSIRVVNVDVANINQSDVWVTQVNEDGEVIKNWTRVDNSYGVGVGFNTLSSDVQSIFEVVTRVNDQIAIRFGDGKFGEIPVGLFRIWFRTSSPVARIVKASDIREKSLTIPYASNGVLYNLTMTYSLTGNLENAAESETDLDIKTRASKVYYSQDRMVNGEDYNSLPLRDNSILKVKTINRTFSGHGRSQPFNDPTGTYSNVKLFGDDGRLFQSFRTNEITVSADVRTLSNTALIANYLEPLLGTDDKKHLYYDIYDEIPLENPAFFKQDSLVGGRSRGRVQRNYDGSDVTVPIGPGAEGALRYIGPDCLIRLNKFNGQLVAVDFVVEDGTAENGLLMKGPVPDHSSIFSVFPAMRRLFNETERQNVIDHLDLKRGFGLRWDMLSLAWRIIEYENIDQTGPFSLRFAGDTSGTGKDASWVVWLRYNAESSSGDTWTIYERGLEYFFESDREVDFYYAESKPVVDPITGRTLRDNIRILRDNETRDSFERRGISPIFGSEPVANAKKIIGNGVDTEFKLEIEDVDPAHVFVTINGLPVAPTEWKILNSPGVDTIKFNSAPAVGAEIMVRCDPRAVYAVPFTINRAGDGSTTVYNLGLTPVPVNNVFAFRDGLALSPEADYITYNASNQDRLETIEPTASGSRLSLFMLTQVGTLILSKRYKADGVATTFPTLARTNDPEKILVFAGGVKKVHGVDYTLDDTDANNVLVKFVSVPEDQTEIDIRISIYPGFFRVIHDIYQASEGQTEYPVTDAPTGLARQILVFVDGLQVDTFTYSAGMVTLATAPDAGSTVEIYFYVTAAGPMGGSVTSVGEGPALEPYPTYLKQDITWWVNGQMVHPDGYPNTNGVKLSLVDQDLNNVADAPFLFRDIVLTDGKSDLVLWRRSEELGYEIWDPISETTVPRGTYTGPNYNYTEGESFEPDLIAPGSIHLDTKNNLWLVADGTTNTWVAAEDQDLFRSEIGRSGIRFSWTHYSPDTHRIDPAPTNINDVYILTSGYDRAVRAWIAANGTENNMPVPATPDELKVQFQHLDKFKMISDAIVWHPARYKILFGPQAAPELRANFVVVRMPGSSIPDNDLKLRILSVIDEYFQVSNWEFGESFYYTELAAFIHRKLATYIQSVVIVPKADDQSFGGLFQVRAQPDELFISSARVEDVEIVGSLTDSRLRIR